MRKLKNIMRIKTWDPTPGWV